MRVQFFKPKNPFLEPYLEGYYFLEKEADEASVTYLTFPNNFSIISVLQNTEIVFEDHSVFIRQKPGNHFSSDLICHYKKPIRIIYEGAIQEITFYFKPLGLNAFIDQPLQHYTGHFFSSFAPHPDYETAMRAILDEPGTDAKRNMAEAYWLSKFTGFSQPLLQAVVTTLMEQQEGVPIQELASKYNTSRQYINKLFDIHLCKTPSEFKKILRFRETLIQRIAGKNKNENLAALSYDNLFYDQSHLIKDFKSLTGLTPGAFFKAISHKEHTPVNWLYLQ